MRRGDSEFAERDLGIVLYRVDKISIQAEYCKRPQWIALGSNLKITYT